jgi:hypothetical protein
MVCCTELLTLYRPLQRRSRLVRSWRLALIQRIIGIVIQSVDFVLVDALIADLNPSGEGPACAQFFDSIIDGLSRRRETPVIGVSSSAP